MIHSNTWNPSTVCKWMNFGSFKNFINKMVYKSYVFNMYKKDLALNNLKWLICHKTQPNQAWFVSLSLSPPPHKFKNLYADWEPDIGLAVRVFANGPGDLGSIPGRVIPKTQKMVLDASLLNFQHYKVCIKGKVEQSRERNSALPYTLV